MTRTPLDRPLWLAAVASTFALAATFSGTSAQQQPAQQAVPWVKICEKQAFFEPDPKDATKPIQKDRNVCMTHHERFDVAAGAVTVSVAVREIEGSDKKLLVVMLPLGVSLRPGMQIGIYPADMWTAINKNQSIDDSKLDRVLMGYSLCLPSGCTAETEATPEIMKRLESSAGMVVLAINGAGQGFPIPVPLNGFTQAFRGQPIDAKTYYGERQKLVQKLDENRKQVIDEYRKQNKELQMVAPRAQAAPAATPAAAPAAAPAAPAATPPAAKKP